MRRPPTTGSASAAVFPVNALDRPWMTQRATSVVGPVDVPARRDIVTALRRLAECGPQTRAGIELDTRAGQWLADPSRVDEICDASVVDAPTSVHNDPEAALRWTAALPTGPPVRFVRAGSHLVLDAVHAIGDVRIMMNLVHAAATARADTNVPAWALVPSEPHPLRAALRRHFGSDRGKVRAALAAVHPTRRRVRAPGPTREWSPEADVVHRATGVDVLRDWRRRHAPGLTRVPVIFAAAHAALRTAGLEPRPDGLMIFDARRYLPAGTSVPGNFVAGVELPFGTRPWPHEMHGLTQEAADIGRPLTAIVAGLTLGRIGRALGSTSGAPTCVVPAPRPQVAYSYVGRPRPIAELPWTGPPEGRVYAGFVRPAGPEGVTLSFAEVGRTLNVSASFHANVFPRARVVAALDSFCADPAALLDTMTGPEPRHSSD